MYGAAPCLVIAKKEHPFLGLLLRTSSVDIWARNTRYGTFSASKNNCVIHSVTGHVREPSLDAAEATLPSDKGTFPLPKRLNTFIGPSDGRPMIAALFWRPSAGKAGSAGRVRQSSKMLGVLGMAMNDGYGNGRR
jgi:hypothetical protein